MEDFTILIPARRNSKGLPFKNRKLLTYTINSIPKELWGKIIVNTDDEVIIDNCIDLGIKYYKRPDIFATDTASTKSVIEDMMFTGNLLGTVIMLYLTYPERTWDDIMSAYHFFIDKNAKSLLCKKEIKGTHPYLYMIELDNNMGEQLREHNLYRRQDYPNVFEISHFVSIFNTSIVSKLNNNLYNKTTLFYPIIDKIDVDTENDINKFLKQ
jgi:CMP-N-acetylneuraminic acid synthetase